LKSFEGEEGRCNKNIGEFEKKKQKELSQFNFDYLVE
jgi:hypothetical protein